MLHISNIMTTVKQKLQKCVTFSTGGRLLISQSEWLMPGVIESWKNIEGVCKKQIEELFEFSDLPSETSGTTGKLLDIKTEFYLPFEVKVLEDNGEYTLQRNEFGCLEKKVIEHAIMPIPLEYPIKSNHDWQVLKRD